MPRRAAPVRDALPRRRQLLEGGKRGHARISSPPASIGAFLSSLLGTSPATHGYCCRYREETRCHANPVTIPPGAWWARMRAPTAARTSSSRSSSSPTLFPSSFLHVDRCTRRPRQLILWPPRSLLGLGKGRAVKGEAAPVRARARWMRRGARRRRGVRIPRRLERGWCWCLEGIRFGRRRRGLGDVQSRYQWFLGRDQRSRRHDVGGWRRGWCGACYRATRFQSVAGTAARSHQVGVGRLVVQCQNARRAVGVS